jgi:hypothetical protein
VKPVSFRDPAGYEASVRRVLPSFLADRTQAEYAIDDPACPPADSEFDVTQHGVLRIVLGDEQVGGLEESKSDGMAEMLLNR